MAFNLPATVSAELISECGIIAFERRTLLDGIQFEFLFENGRGASVVNHSYSYGVELAVLNYAGDIDYSTPITDNVRGYLTPEELVSILIDISNLPSE